MLNDEGGEENIIDNSLDIHMQEGAFSSGEGLGIGEANNLSTRRTSMDISFYILQLERDYPRFKQFTISFVNEVNQNLHAMHLKCGLNVEFCHALFLELITFSSGQAGINSKKLHTIVYEIVEVNCAYHQQHLEFTQANLENFLIFETIMQVLRNQLYELDLGELKKYPNPYRN